MTFQDVIRMLRINYKMAIKSSGIRKPLAWALYHTWKYVDEHEEYRKP